MSSGLRAKSVETTTPTAMNDANSIRQIKTRSATLTNESAVPYSQIASVSSDVTAITMYPTSTLAAPSRKLQQRIASVDARWTRFEMVTITPPVPIPSRARPMTRYV